MASSYSYTIKFEKMHKDTLSGLAQHGKSSYELTRLKQSRLPTIIEELTEKGYDILIIMREGYNDTSLSYS